MRKLVFLITLFPFLFMGCRAELRYATHAELSLQLSTEGEFSDPISNTKATVKAEDDIKPELGSFSLSIKSRTDGQTVHFWDKYADVPSVISLDPGAYTIQATSPGDKPVEWHQPMYVGAQDVNVAAGKSESVSIVCKLSNMKVTVRVADEFVAEMKPDYTVVVANEDGFLEWDRFSIEAGHSGYYSVKPLTLDIKATRASTGAPITHHLSITNVAPQDHHILTIYANETGEITLGDGISIDYTVNNKEEYIFIDALEENPIEDDKEPTPEIPDEPDQPVMPEVEPITITCPGVTEPAVFSASNLPEKIDFTLEVEAVNGIENLIMTVDSPSLITLLTIMEGAYGDLNPVDMAHMTPGQVEFWGGELVFNGLKSEDVLGETKFSLDVAPFIPMIAELEDKNITHDMSVEVVDKSGNNKKAGIKITMNE